MAKFVDIAPPPPPQFSKDETVTDSSSKKTEKVDSSKNVPKKSGFFKKMFGKKELLVSEEPKQPAMPPEEFELDLEKIRDDFRIPKKEERSKEKPVKAKKEKKKLKEPKVKNKSSKSATWTEGDIVEEIHKPKVKGPRWDVEEPVAIKSKVVSKTKTIKPKMKNVKSSVKKVKVVKHPKEVSVNAPSIKKEKLVMKKVKLPKMRTAVDRVIEQYFKSVEREQQLIQKELENIVVHPKKALQKGPNEYIIHHNEKLIKSMKNLLAAIKSIDHEKFDKRVSANKKDFQKWVTKILQDEKKAEEQRNKILKQKMKELMKKYGEGINKDIQDKKYELNSQNP